MKLEISLDVYLVVMFFVSLCRSEKLIYSFNDEKEDYRGKKCCVSNIVDQTAGFYTIYDLFSYEIGV